MIITNQTTTPSRPNPTTPPPQPDFYHLVYLTILQMSLGELPLLTRGPQALFYGGEAIIPFLSTKTPGRHTFIALVIFIMFHFCLILYKKLVMRKFLSVQRLKEVVVNNLLNIYKILSILVVLLLIMLTLFIHNRIIRDNSSDEKMAAGKKSSFNGIMLVALLETFMQAFPFITNPALR